MGRDSRGGAPASREAQVKALIRRRYRSVADGALPIPDAAGNARRAGYPASWLDRLPPEVANRYAGCGFLLHGLDLAGCETVVDLGCGAGLDARLAAEGLGGRGRVIALDLTPEMARAARAAAGDTPTPVLPVTGDMEALPLPDRVADLVVANAALNLALDPARAFAEARRVLRPGGRLVARDLVRDRPLPPEVLADPMSFATSLGGVLEEPDLRAAVAAAGFTAIEISDHRPFPPVISVRIEATR